MLIGHGGANDTLKFNFFNLREKAFNAFNASSVFNANSVFSASRIRIIRASNSLHSSCVIRVICARLELASHHVFPLTLHVIHSRQ